MTPSLAVLCVGLATAACMFLGDAILVPVTEVGSVAAAMGWLGSCASYYRMNSAPCQRLVAAAGAMITLAMVLMKVVPGVPGHFSGREWLTLAIWAALGILLSRARTVNRASDRASTPCSQRSRR